MKFEQFLTIYWARYILCNGKTHSFDTYPFLFLTQQFGFGPFISNIYMCRFEIIKYYFFRLEHNFQKNHPFMGFSFNVFLARLTNINKPLFFLKKIFLIRKYMNRSTIGKAHALGKPVHGQRTWSNANTSYIYNTLIRKFVNDVKKTIITKKKPEKINYKLIKKKQKKPNKAFYVKFKKPSTVIWF